MDLDSVDRSIGSEAADAARQDADVETVGGENLGQFEGLPLRSTDVTGEKIGRQHHAPILSFAGDFAVVAHDRSRAPR